MVGDENTYVSVLELPNYLLDILNGYRIDTGKGFVEHNKLRVDGKATGNLGAAALATRQLVALVLAHFLQSELSYQTLKLFKLVGAGLACHLKH